MTINLTDANVTCDEIGRVTLTIKTEGGTVCNFRIPDPDKLAETAQDAAHLWRELQKLQRAELRSSSKLDAKTLVR